MLVFSNVRRWFAVGVLAVLTACGDGSLRLSLPPGEFQSELLFARVSGDDDRSRLFAVSATDPALPLDAELFSDDRIAFEAMVFEESLCDLGLAPGVLVPASPGICVPQADRHFVSVVEDGELTASWTEVPGAPEFAGSSFMGNMACAGADLSCLASGQCLDAPGGTCGACDVEPAPEPPRPPEDPRLVRYADPLAGGVYWYTAELSNPPATVPDPWGDMGSPCNRGWRMRLPGEPDCREQDPCPSGDWPADAGCGVPGVIHVDGNAALGGNGTCMMPFATIAEALAVAPDGATVALHRGVRHELTPVHLDRAVRIRGVCVGENYVITSTTAADPDFVLTTTADLTLEGIAWRGQSRGIQVRGAHFSADRVSFGGTEVQLQLVDGATGVIDESHFGSVDEHVVVVEGGSSLTFRDSIVERSNGNWITVDASELTVDNAWFRRPQPSAALTEPSGFAIHATNGSSVEVVDTLISSTVGSAIRVDRSTLIATNFASLDSTISEGVGAGVEATNSQVTLRQWYVRNAVGPAVHATDSNVTLVDGVVRGGEDLHRNTGGGLLVRGGTIDIQRLQVANVTRFGVSITATGTVADVYVARVERDVDGSTPAAAMLSGDIVLDGLLAEDAGDAVVVERGNVTVTDLTSTDGSVGISVRSGNVDVTRADIQTEACGVTSAAETAELSLEDVRIGGLSSAACALSIGEIGGSPTALSITRLRADDTLRSDLLLASGTVEDGAFGTVFVSGGELTVNRMTARSLTVDDSATVTITDARIVNDEPAPAVLAADGARIDANGFVIDGGTVGIRVCASAEAALENGTVSGGQVGVELPRGHDLSSLSSQVAYEGRSYAVCDGALDPCAD